MNKFPDADQTPAIPLAAVVGGFLTAGNRLADSIRERNWDETALGDMALWPSVVKSTLATWMDSPQPMCFAWGAELRFFFNTA